MSAAYRKLHSLCTRLGGLRGAASILNWDAATLMPEGASPVRAEQLAALAELSHEMLTHPSTAELIAGSEAHSHELDEWQRANLREFKRQWLHETSVPKDLVGAQIRACSASEIAWRSAKKSDDFKSYAPHLEEVLKLSREAAQAKATALSLSPYDALLDAYEPGARSAEIEALFADLRAFLPGFTAQALEAQQNRPALLKLEGAFPTDKQKALGKHFMQALGFDFNRGRLDESAHPFCGGVPGDVRITTRYNEQEFFSSLMGIMHETGHALYEQGLPEAWHNQPVGEARGMSVHESQSLLVEMQLCRSRDFLDYAAPIIRDAFGASGPAWEAENLARLAARVERSFIRVNADEVTYPSHVILRYGLEKAMIAGELAINDLPQAWNEGMKELLGITPPTFREGCLQDIHWPEGMFGYFPTYTLGAMTAAQIFAAARKQLTDLPSQIRKGSFAPLVGWLRENIHAKASLLPTRELLIQATGQPLDVAIYKQHLKQRYL